MEKENAKVKFSLEEVSIKVECNKEEKMKDICQRFAKEINKNINSLLFLYEGNKFNLELSYKEVVNALDEKKNEMNILAYNRKNNINISHKYDDKLNIMKEDIEKFNNKIIDIVSENNIDIIKGKSNINEKQNIKNIIRKFY